MMHPKSTLLLFIISLCTLSGCVPNTNKPFDKEGKSLDSITYININSKASGSALDVFIPVSYLEKGEQLLKGDMGPYSLFAGELLQDAPSAESLSKTDTGDMYMAGSDAYDNQVQAIDSVATNGTWDLFPSKVTYRKYTIENQPNHTEWTDYFRGQLDTISSDVPLIITDAWFFDWNGTETAVVTASNVLALGSGEDNLISKDLCQSAQPPANNAPVIYIAAALFVQGNTPMELFYQYYEIPKTQKECAWLGVSYAPWDDRYSLYVQFLSAIQYNESGEVSLFPIFCNHGGELNLRDFQYKPQCLICDIDGDGQSELVMNIARTSSTMRFYEVYRLEKNTPAKTLHIVCN